LEEGLDHDKAQAELTEGDEPEGNGKIISGDFYQNDTGGEKRR
jgi:hypothetical protein